MSADFDFGQNTFVNVRPYQNGCTNEFSMKCNNIMQTNKSIHSRRFINTCYNYITIYCYATAGFDCSAVKHNKFDAQV